MKDTFKYLDEFDQHKNGELNQEEAQNFQDRLEKDKEFAEEFNLYQAIISTIEEDNDQLIRLELQDIRKELALEAKQKTVTISPVSSTQRAPLFKAWMGIAASILILISLLSYANLKYADTALQNLRADKLLLDTGTTLGSPNTKKPFEEGMIALEAGKYQDAIDFFQQVADSDASYPAARLRLAFSQLQLSDYLQAKNNAIVALRTSTLEVRQQEAEWLLLQVQLANKETNTLDFQQLLAKIAVDKNHTFQQEAIDLQIKLNSAWRRLTF